MTAGGGERDEMERPVRGSVGGLADFSGEVVVEIPPLELPLRHEKGGRGC